MNDVSEVTWCIPCPANHTEDFEMAIRVTLPFEVSDGAAVAIMEDAARRHTDKPVTVHKGPVLQFHGHEWAVTIP